MLVWAAVSFWSQSSLPLPLVEVGVNTLYQEQHPNVFKLNSSALYKLCHDNWSLDFTSNSKLSNEQHELAGPLKLAQVSIGNQVHFAALHFSQWYPDPVNVMLDDWHFFQNPNFTHN